MELFFFICLLLLPVKILTLDYVKPEIDGRSYFALTVANAIEEHRQLYVEKETSYTISPAAIQKMFAILYNAADDIDDLHDLLLLEMGLKYYDEMHLMELAIKEMTTFDVLKEEQLDKLDKPIKRADVLDYFKNDFNELNKMISYENYLIAPKELQFSNEFVEFSKQFFNATLVNEKDLSKMTATLSKFDLSKKHINSINLFSSISLISDWKPVFIERHNILSTHGEFRFGEIKSSEDHHVAVEILELPLESPINLNVLLIAPKHAHDLNFTTSYEVIRALTVAESSESILKSQHMDIMLPKVFQFQTTTDLSAYFNKNGLTNGKIFGAPQAFKRMFSNLPKIGIKLGVFEQYTNLELKAKIVDELPKAHHSGFLHNLKEKFIDLTQTEKFDLTDKPFLFILKSENVIYFMGQYYAKKNK